MRIFESLIDASYPGRTALLFEGQAYSYAQIGEAATAVGDRIRQRGIVPGCKVAVSLPNTPTLVTTMVGLDRLGAVSVPLPPTLTATERARVFEIAEPDFVVEVKGEYESGPGAFLSSARDGIPQPDEELDGVATVIFTSGTTGQPKGVMLTADALLANAASVCQYVNLTPADRTLIFLPLCYSFGMSQWLSTWLSGGAVVLLKSLAFPRQAIELIDQHQVTGFGGVPTSLDLLASQVKQPCPSLRYILSAGGPLSRPLVERVQAAFPGVDVFNNYGCTEFGPRATAVSQAQHPDRIGSIGRAIPNAQVTIRRQDMTEAAPMETGEIVISGPSLMKGYYRNPDATVSRMSQWGFHTGDQAYADPDGFLYFQGRQDDVFKCQGEKVSALEIENVLLEHPGVREAAVVAEPDRLLGHVPVAFVVGFDRNVPTTDELRAFCRTKLSLHKVPRRIHFQDVLDRTSSGKVQKHRLSPPSTPT